MAFAASDGESSADDAALGMVMGGGKKRGGKARPSFMEALSNMGQDSDDEGMAAASGASKRRARGKGKAKAKAKEGGAAALKAELVKAETKGDEKKKTSKAEKKDKAESNKRTKEKDTVAEEDGADAGAAAGKPPSVRGGRKRKVPAATDALGAAADADGVATANEGSQKPAQRRRRARPLEDGDDVQDQGEGPAARGRKPAGAGRGKAAKKKEESESELEVDEEEARTWMDHLRSRVDPAHSTLLRTAYSMKECPASAIRRLDVKSFLGCRKLEDGGRLLFDEENKVNLHFLVGTYAAIARARERQRQGEEVPTNIDDKDLRYLRWLVRQARELRVVSRGELKRGKVLAKRLVSAKKAGAYSLALEANLVDVRDGQDEGLEAAAEGPLGADAKFPERKATVQDTSGINQERLKSHVVTRQTSISVTTSHNVDVHKMREILTAPSLSFDWEQRDDDDEEGGLEVDIPESDVRESKRDLLRDQLRRSMSATQAKGLSRADRSNTGLGRSQSTRDFSDQDSQSKPKQLLSKKVMRKGSQASDLHNLPAQADSVQERGVDLARAPTEVAQPGDVVSEAQSSSEVGQAPAIVGTSVQQPEISPTLDSKSHDAETSTSTVTKPDHESSLAQMPVNSVDAAAVASAVKPTGVSAASPTPPAEDAASVAEQTVTPPAAASSSDPCPGNAKDADRGAATTSTASATASCGDAKGSLAEAGICPSISGGDVSNRVAGACDPTQDWPDDISPTNMWGGNAWAGSQSHAGATEQASAATPKHPVEISPTLPFDPAAADAGQAPVATPVEISPTVPFVPAPAEISPTVPFVAEPFEPSQRPAEISPTMPFLLAGDSGGAHGPPTGFADAPERAKGEVCTDNPLAAKEPTLQDATGRGTLAGTEQPRKRAAAPVREEDEPSESEDDAGALKGAAGAEGHPPVSEADEKRLRQERRWLRQKRRKLQEEEGLKRLQEAKLERELRRAEVMHRLGTSMMSKEDQSRYDEVVAAGMGQVRTRAGIGLRALTGAGSGAGVEEDEDAALFGGVRKGAPKRPGFLLTSSTVAS